MGNMHEHLDAKRLASLAQDPDYTPNHADKVDAAMLHLNGLLAERAVLNTAGQALDASRRAAFEAIRSDAAPIKTTPTDDPTTDDWCTSLQPLGDASVLVAFANDDDGLSIEGAFINAEFVHVDNFSNFVRGQWEKAIRAEERKDAEIASWGE